MESLEANRYVFRDRSKSVSGFRLAILDVGLCDGIHDKLGVTIIIRRVDTEAACDLLFAESKVAWVVDKVVVNHVHRVWVVDCDGLLQGLVSLTDIIRVIKSSLFGSC
ncbi:hypothetical protein OROHE_002034 [Orobanche hederae]